MKFIKMEELRPGMRLARPIYSKKGVLLYERAGIIKDDQAIQNIRGFGLLGLFILEPSEPVPPFSEEDMEFERFQTMMTFEISEELGKIRKSRKTDIRSTSSRAFEARKTMCTNIRSIRPFYAPSSRTG